MKQVLFFLAKFYFLSLIDLKAMPEDDVMALYRGARAMLAEG